MFRGKPEQQNDIELFLIYDSKIGAYERPNFFVNQHDLVRSMLNLFRDPQQTNNKYLINAEDYSAFKVGGLDYKTGKFSTYTLEHVVNFHDLRTMVQKEQQTQNPVGIPAT